MKLYMSSLTAEAGPEFLVVPHEKSVEQLRGVINHLLPPYVGLFDRPYTPEKGRTL